MTDWLGTTTFELDFLHQLTTATDHAGKRVEYTYDGVGRVTEMRYPNGWVEYYTYDKMGRILKVEDTHPSEKPAKTQKHTYAYDANGNITYEYMRGNGVGQAKNETLYTYDALNRLIGSTRKLEVYPYDTLAYTYTYDTLGNLLKQSGPTKGEEDTYQYNDLNQMVSKHVCGYEQKLTRIYDYGYTYDKRGNLVKEEEIWERIAFSYSRHRAGRCANQCLEQPVCICC